MPTENPHHERRWLILALIGIAQLMVVLDATIVNIALPSAQKALNFSDDSRQWIITAYALAFGSLLLLGGRISDLFGRKWTFIVGLLGFAGASAVGGAAQSFGVLVAARGLQGAFGALLAPAALSLLTTTFTDAGERAKAFGVFGAIAGSGGSVGLLMGGFLTEWLSWRWCMYVNLAFAIPAAIGALSLLTNMRPAHRPRIDLPGVVLASGGLFALVFGLSNAEMDSWSAPLTIGMLAGAVVALVGFVVWQTRARGPLLPLRVVLDRNRGGSYLAVLVSGTGIFGVFLFLTFYLQRTLGYSPIETGLGFMPMNIAIMTTAMITTSRLLPKIGPRLLVSGGMVLAGIGLALLTGLDVDSTYAAHVLPSLILIGVGFGLIFAPAMATATLGVEPQDAGVASAMVSTAQQVGGSIGTALLSTLAASASTSYLSSHEPSRGAIEQAAIAGDHRAFVIAAGIFAVGAVVSLLVLRPGTPHARTANASAGEAAGAEPVLAH